MNKIYRNSTEVCNLGGASIYMNDVVTACLYGKLNLFLKGDTGSGKTQLAADAMSYFPEKSLFILGRNDMDTRELFQIINLQKLKDSNSTENIKETSSKIKSNLIVVDELPNCVPAVRAQLFNLFDGFIEINGVRYPIGEEYSVGIATGNIGQQFTESSNDLGRALKDRMHVTVDTDYFSPKAYDTLDILAGNLNPRVEFSEDSKSNSLEIISKYEEIKKEQIPFEKLLISNYLLHGLDYCTKGSKRKMKSAWPTQLDNHEQGSDVGLVLPVSIRAAKSILKLSQCLDHIARERSGNPTSLESMMQSYKLVSTNSGVLNEGAVQNKYDGDHYAAMDAVIATTLQQFKDKENDMRAGLEMVRSGKKDERVLMKFNQRWTFMKDTLVSLIKEN